MSMLEVDAIIKSNNEKFINNWEQIRLLRNTIGVCLGVKLEPLKFSWDTEKETKPETTKQERIQAEQNMLKWLAEKYSGNI